MLLNGSDNQKLFSNFVKVAVKDSYSDLYRRNLLFFTMEWQEASSGSYPKQKVLSITLTDNDDPFFFYNTHVAEEEFQKLKAERELKEDFSTFPQLIIGQIEKCLDEEKNPQPKFLIVFKLNSQFENADAPPKLDFIEKGRFGNVTHLSLKFNAATESAVRQYLISSFRCLKEEKRQLQNNLAFMEQDLKDKLAASQNILTNKVQELGEVIKQLKFELNEKDNKYKIELQDEKDRFISKHKDEINRFEKEMKEKEYIHNKEIQRCESSVKAFEAVNKDLFDKNSQNESAIRDLRSKLLSVEEEKNSLKEKFQSCKHKFDHLQSELKEKQSRLRLLEDKVRNLEQESRSIKESNLRLKNKIESEIELKKSIETELENVKFRLDQSKRAELTLVADKERLNEILVNFEEKLKGLTKEEKNKSLLLTKYKKTIEGKDEEILHIKQKIGELNIELRAKDAEIRHLIESECKHKEEIDALKKDEHSKIEIIQWLNKQLTDNCIVPQYPAPFDPAGSPSTVAKEKLSKIGSKNSPPQIPVKNAATKSVRIEETSPVCKQSSSTPSQLYKTDSAYCTAALDSNQATPEILAGNHNMNPSDFEIDQDALSAAFRNEGSTLKHSTAKKPTRPVKSTPTRPVNSTTPKYLKKR